LSQQTLGPYLRDITEDFGRYMSILLQGLGIGVHAAYTPLTAPLPTIQFCDLKSKRFYETIVRQIGPRRSSVGLLLTSILSQVNTARVLIPRITEGNEAAAFKIRFVSLFHAISSLQKLLGQHHKGPLLHTAAEEQIRAILGEASIRTIRKNQQRYAAATSKVIVAWRSVARLAAPRESSTKSSKGTVSKGAPSPRLTEPTLVTTPSLT